MFLASLATTKNVASHSLAAAKVRACARVKWDVCVSPCRWARGLWWSCESGLLRCSRKWNRRWRRSASATRPRENPSSTPSRPRRDDSSTTSEQLASEAMSTTLMYFFMPDVLLSEQVIVVVVFFLFILALLRSCGIFKSGRILIIVSVAVFF